LQSIKDIFKHKGSDIAVFLGSGESINNITEAQWEKISTFDTWTTNNWLYHPFTPKFYHVEVKKYNREIWKKRRIESGDRFKETIFIINRDRKYLLDVIGEHEYIYGYKMHKINSKKKDIVPKYRPKKNPEILTCNLNASLTMILELFWRFEYKKVVFFGTDMNNSKYFWTGRKEFGETHCQTNKDHEGKDPELPHGTAHLKNFIVWFSQKRMKKVGGEFCVGYTDTLLYPDLNLVNIEEL